MNREPQAVDDNEAVDTTRTPLPAGYRYDDPANATPEERAALQKNPDFSEDQITESIAFTTQLWQDLGIESLDVAVRDTNDQLVAFGKVLYKDGRGEIGSLAVSPNHQRRGLGSAIVKERLRLAEAAGIHSLYIPYLEDSNGLGEEFYLAPDIAFRKTAAGEIVRGPDPASITGIPPKTFPAASPNPSA